MNKKLRWVKHDIHIDILKEFYYLNKYYMTEQLKDSIADAIECLKYIEDNKICGKEKCRGCESFGWTCDLKGENPNGFYTCEMTNTKIALTDKDYEPTREDFIKSDIVFRKPDYVERLKMCNYVERLKMCNDDERVNKLYEDVEEISNNAGDTKEEG